jgi:succinate dehydrogenase / fumarate reductase cytochrome b subunit
MAVTGLVVVGFLIEHVSGNLLVFRSQEFNRYAAFLKGAGGFLWVARPVRYQRRDPQVSTFAVRTIRWSGALILLFLVLHLLHFTTGTIQPAPFSVEDVYANIIGSFRIWWVSAFYIVLMIPLGLHIYHGAWSSFRTLGTSRPKPDPLHRSVATVVALGVWLGFTLIPVAMMLGVVP